MHHKWRHGLRGRGVNNFVTKVLYCKVLRWVGESQIFTKINTSKNEQKNSENFRNVFTWKVCLEFRTLFHFQVTSVMVLIVAWGGWLLKTRREYMFFGIMYFFVIFKPAASHLSSSFKISFNTMLWEKRLKHRNVESSRNILV